ncbi:hypothetical protein NKG05_20715 [Oerskovia sp. M15]
MAAPTGRRSRPGPPTIRGFDEHPEVHSELTGRRGHHAGELPASDNGDHWC